MQQIPFSRFKRLLAKDIKGCNSFEVIADGELLFLCAIPPNPYMCDSIRSLMALGNTTGKKELDTTEG